MPKAERSATAHWEGDLASGKGTVRVASGAIPELPVTWKARTEDSGGMTSPEELIAAAEASCFCMALSHELASAGHAPRSLDAKATCTIEQVEGGWAIKTMQIDLTGDVPGMDDAAFQKAANGAKTGCPVSKALANNVAFSLTARLKTS